MDDRDREHPDEGTIHAWLDGALDAAAARALEAHVATCRECAERVAEARGLIAGASRIVSALDDAASTTGPAWGQAPAAPAAPPAAARRMWRVTPARAAIAATVLVALGVSLTYERVAIDSQATSVMQERATVPSTDSASVPAAPMEAGRRDPLLDSAVKRNIAASHPPRAVGPAPGPALPVPTAALTNAIAAAPDQLAGRAGAVARPAEDRAMAAATRADTVTGRPQGAYASAAAGAAVQSQAQGQLAAAECYRVESANGVAATWGVDVLPLVVRVDSAGRAAVFTVAGQPTGSQAMVTRTGEDSLLLRLRRIGYEGTLALGAPGEARAGVMRSRPLQSQLESVVTTAAPAEEPAARPARRRMPAPEAKEPAKAETKAAAPPSAEVRSAVTAAPAVPVVARRVGCPR